MSFIKSVVQSLIVSLLFALVSLSLFVGNFPPSVKQVKGVFTEYQKMMKFKEQMMNQYAHKDPAELVEALERQQREQLKALAMSRGSNPQLQQEEVVATETMNRGVASVQAAQVQTVDVKVVNEQIYQLQAELARLNQRVYQLESELEAQKLRK